MTSTANIPFSDKKENILYSLTEASAGIYGDLISQVLGSKLALVEISSQ